MAATGVERTETIQWPGLSAAAPEPTYPRSKALHQLERLEAGMSVLADNEMVVHRDTEGACELHNRLRHLDVGARGGRIA